MKKFFKIVGIIFAAILCIVLIFCCFPWVFTTKLVEKKFPNVNKPLEQFEEIHETIPEDWVTEIVEGVAVKGPEEALCKDKEIIAFQIKGEFYVGISYFDSSEYYYEDEEYDEDEKEAKINEFINNFIQNRTDHLYKKLGYDPKTLTNNDKTEIILNMNMSQYRKLMGLDALMFVIMAHSKETFLMMDNWYSYNCNGKHCLMTKYTNSEKNTENYIISYNKGTESYTVVVKSNDDKLARQLISSIEFPEE